MPNHQSLDPGRQSDAPLRRRSAEAAGPTPDAATAPHPLLTLQRQLGNTTIARMIAQRAAPEEDEEPIQATHDPALAQRVAPEEDEEPVQAQHDPALAQRAAAEEEEEPIQAKPEVGLEGGPVSESLAGRIQARRGGGAALPDAQREQMEAAFGTSFQDVRIHTGPEADALNRSISAKAFTTGSDIFFRQDASPGDQDLLAHELTHVVQQRSMSHSGPMSVGPAGDSYEQQADAMARAVASGAHTALGQGAAGSAQRQAAGPEEEEERTEAH